MNFWCSFFSETSFFCYANEVIRNAAISIEGYEGEDGEVEIAVFIESAHGVCGVIFELDYDPDAFLLLSVGAEMCELDLSYNDDLGEVKILLDGVENTDENCEIVRLFFKRRAGSVSRAEFNLCDGAEAFSLRGGDLIREEILVGKGSFFVERGDTVGNCEAEAVFLSAVLSESGEVELELAVRASGGAFAIGAEIFIIDFGGNGELYEFFVSSVVADHSCGKMRCRSSLTGSFCAVITPLGYWGRRRVAGKKRFAMISVRDGAVYVEFL